MGKLNRALWWLDSDWDWNELVDSGRENGKSFKRLKCTDIAVRNCTDRPAGFKQTHSTCKTTIVDCIASRVGSGRIG